MSAALGIGMGATAVGGILQAVAAKKARDATDAALQDELNRQQAFRNEALQAFQPGIKAKGVETAREQISKGAQKREQAYQTVGNAQFGLNGPNMNARDQATYKLKGMARAKLGGYSDWSLDQMIQNIRLQDELNRISNFAGGTAQVFPYRLFDAQHSADDLAAAGGLISSIGGSAPAWGSLFGGGEPTPQRGGYGAGARGYFDAPQGFGQQYEGQV